MKRRRLSDKPPVITQRDDTVKVLVRAPLPPLLKDFLASPEGQVVPSSMAKMWLPAIERTEHYVEAEVQLTPLLYFKLIQAPSTTVLYYGDSDSDGDDEDSHGAQVEEVKSGSEEEEEDEHPSPPSD